MNKQQADIVRNAILAEIPLSKGWRGVDLDNCIARILRELFPVSHALGLTKQQLIEALKAESAKCSSPKMLEGIHKALKLAEQLTEPAPAPCEREADDIWALQLTGGEKFGDLPLTDSQKDAVTYLRTSLNRHLSPKPGTVITGDIKAEMIDKPVRYTDGTYSREIEE